MSLMFTSKWVSRAEAGTMGSEPSPLPYFIRLAKHREYFVFVFQFIYCLL